MLISNYFSLERRLLDYSNFYSKSSNKKRPNKNLITTFPILIPVLFNPFVNVVAPFVPTIPKRFASFQSRKSILPAHWTVDQFSASVFGKPFPFELFGKPADDPRRTPFTQPRLDVVDQNEYLANEDGLHRNYWEKHEIRKFLGIVKKDCSQRDYMMFHLLIYTGARKGEILALH